MKKDRRKRNIFVSGKDGWKVETGEQEFNMDYLFSLPPFSETRDETGSVPIGCRVPDYISRLLTYLKESDESSYQIKSDVVRDTVIIGLLVRLQQHNLEGSSLLNIELERALQTSQVSRKIHDRFQQLADNVSFMLSHDDADKAIELVSNIGRAMSAGLDPWIVRTYRRLFKENAVLRDLVDKCEPEVQAAIKG